MTQWVNIELDDPVLWRQRDRTDLGAPSLAQVAEGHSAGGAEEAVCDSSVEKPERPESAPANHLEKLKDSRAGQHSIRINDQWRVCFRWAGTDAYDVEIVDYH